MLHHFSDGGSKTGAKQIEFMEIQITLRLYGVHSPLTLQCCYVGCFPPPLLIERKKTIGREEKRRKGVRGRQHKNIYFLNNFMSLHPISFFTLWYNLNEFFHHIFGEFRAPNILDWEGLRGRDKWVTSHLLWQYLHWTFSHRVWAHIATGLGIMDVYWVKSLGEPGSSISERIWLWRNCWAACIVHQITSVSAGMPFCSHKY